MIIIVYQLYVAISSPIRHRFGLVLGAVCGTLGSALTTYCFLYEAKFWIFCVSCIPQGIASGFSNYYRHIAATQISSQQFMPHAISMVISGGIVAAIMGPQISAMALNAVKDHPFAGIYAILTCLFLVSVVVLMIINYNPMSLVREETTHLQKVEREERPLGEIIADFRFIVAIVSGRQEN